MLSKYNRKGGFLRHSKLAETLYQRAKETNVDK
jgi:hypothetical protein